MMSMVIKAKGLGRDYDGVNALRDVNLSIEKGRVIALLGPNGAGKTTFLRILMGLLEPTRGKAYVLGSETRYLPGKVVGRIGYMGDSDEPPRWSSLQQIIKLQAGAFAQFDRAFAEKFLTKRGLNLKSLYGSLSRGQKKWIRAALVLASKPELMLLDEPAEGLDPSARQELYDELRDCVSDSEATAVVATHIISDIERIADDVAVINKGQVVVFAQLEDLREQVREVQLKEEEPMPDFGEGIEVLGSKKTSGSVLVWVRCTEEKHDRLKEMSDVIDRMRPIGLETFYMAITEHSKNSTRNGVDEGE